MNKKGNNEITLIVQLANQCCWKSGLGYGYMIGQHELLTMEDIWQLLTQKFPRANRFACGQYVNLLENPSG